MIVLKSAVSNRISLILLGYNETMFDLNFSNQTKNVYSPRLEFPSVAP